MLGVQLGSVGGSLWLCRSQWSFACPSPPEGAYHKLSKALLCSGRSSLPRCGSLLLCFFSTLHRWCAALPCLPPGRGLAPGRALLLRLGQSLAPRSSGVCFSFHISNPCGSGSLEHSLYSYLLPCNCSLIGNLEQQQDFMSIFHGALLENHN